MATALLSCKLPSQHKKSVDIKQEKAETKTSKLPAVGEKIQGDFNGDGQTDFATATKVKERQGNPIEGGTPAEYEIRFSDDNLKSIKAGCCDIRLINEGDLNNDGADDISVFQAPMNGCTYTMTSYSFTNRSWKPIVQPFLIPTGCDNLSDDDVQKRIFKEKNAIYYYYTDPNDENGKLIKKKVTTKLTE